MKLKRWIIWMIMACGLTFVVSSQEDARFDPLGESDVDLPKMIRVQVEFIEMAHAHATELLAKPRTSANDTDLRKQCAVFINDGTAGVLETAMVVCRSGQRATSESYSELIYPTEYEPAGGRLAKQEKDGTTTITSGPSHATPVVFDTRKIGSTLEIEPMIGANSKLVDLRLAPELVYHTENTPWLRIKNEDGENEIKFPRFYVLRLSTGVTMLSGQSQLVAAVSPKDENGLLDHTRKVLVFARADVITVGK